MLILNIATIVCIGLMTGTEFAVSAFINPVLRKLENGAQIHAIRLFAERLGFAMPFWYGLGMLLLLVETFLLRHQPRVVPLAFACGIWAAAIILSVLFLVPINNRLARFEDSGVVEKAQNEHRRWDVLHRARVLALTTAMVLFLVSIGS
jgi:uncharacterized membrane protein